MEQLDQLRGILGIVVILGLCWLLSTNRKRVNWALIAWGLVLQVVFAFLVLKTSPGRAFFEWVNGIFVAMINYVLAGASFVFGNLVWNNVPVGPGTPNVGGPPPVYDGSVAAVGSLFAFQVLPTIIFFSSLMAIMYHLRVMEHVVRGIAWVMVRTMGTSGSESLSAAANIFVGQTEAPLVVRPFLPTMTRSEIMAIMTGGMATVAGGVMLAYIGFLQEAVEGIGGHLLAASIMSAPAGLVCAKLMVPETEESKTMGTLKVDIPRDDVNVIDAAARGAAEGLKLALNVGAMLIAFLALLALADALLGWVGMTVFGIGDGAGESPLSLSLIFGFVFWPLAWVMGIATPDCMTAGNLIGVKTFANEFVAYAQLASPDVYGPMDERSRIILTYALCGFANFGSIGILIGGMSPLAPERRHDMARVGLRALIAGSFAAFMTACIAGMLVTEGTLLTDAASAVAAGP
jgi:CNT family concentrative nucleoside transporter